MKSKPFVLFVALLVTCAAWSQNNDLQQKNRFWNHALVELNSGVSPASDNRTMFMGVNMGYKFGMGLSVFGRFESQLRLLKNNGAKNYLEAPHSLSLGLGYRLFTIPEFRSALEFRCMAGHSVGKNDFKYMLYDAGVTLKLAGNLLHTFGLGYRYLDVNTTGMSDIKHFYVSIGFGI